MEFETTVREESSVKIRAALVGDSGVGKTSVLIRYTENKFLAAVSSSMGIDWREKQIEVDGKKVKLQIWDTAGQERFSVTVPVFFRRANVIILLYDITNMTSFHSLNDWIDKIPLREEILVVLVGNKLDLEEKREVSRNIGQEKAYDIGCVPFFETSAKDNTNIDQVFTSIVSDILRKNSLGYEQSRLKRIDTRLTTEKPSKRCCI